MAFILSIANVFTYDFLCLHINKYIVNENIK